MFSQSNWKWKCKECGHEFYGLTEKEVPIKYNCPKCGSKEVESKGPIVHDMPLENPHIKY